ncbi:MAG: prepilin-type N-terminal cleavage/methylation domain-containing protein [Pyrinomonadaceae bacterium]|nr:prepilin-type N-terminal cleavage/methylation domain-containing protein [Pyrinomonadaceae bacterium]
MEIKISPNQRGFNLLELMIVISVIALLISVSGYAWQVMVRRGNEAAAITHLTKINTAQAYFASRRKGTFAKGFVELVRTNLLERSFRKEVPVVDGYRFTLKRLSNRSFELHAEPESRGLISGTGTRSYYLDSSQHAITYTDEERPATAEDEEL